MIADNGWAVVITFQLKREGEHLTVAEMMHTPFQGEDAAVRADNFLCSERTRDFTADGDWYWTMEASDVAREFMGRYRTAQMLGEPLPVPKAS